jgi:hypothetical protein
MLLQARCVSFHLPKPLKVSHSKLILTLAIFRPKSWLKRLLRASGRKSLQEVATQTIITPPCISALQALPAELHLKIFSRLDECASACLGLTCHRFYQIHHCTFPRTSIMTRGTITHIQDLGIIGKLEVHRYVYLVQLLVEWLGGKKNLTWAQKRALLYAKDFQRKDNKRQEKLEDNAINEVLCADPILDDMVWEERLGRAMI